MLNQPVDKYQNRQLLEAARSAFVIVFESEGHKTVLKLDNSAFSNHRTFGVTTGIAHGLVDTAQRRTDQNMPAFLTNVSQQQININAAASVFSKPAPKQLIAPVQLAMLG